MGEGVVLCLNLYAETGPQVTWDTPCGYQVKFSIPYQNTLFWTGVTEGDRESETVSRS